ncbi:hypothetical protein ACHAP7_010809 [Fusarium lateritium]
MSVVAVAGGSGSIGRSVVEAILADGKFEVVILSRKVDPELEKTLGVRIVAVDYSNPDAIATLLEENHINTVISGLSSHAPTEHESNLIQAASRSSITKRYIPSAWGCKFRPEHTNVPLAVAKLAFFKQLEQTTLEWTVIASGVFLDYWGMPKIKTYLTPFTQVLDIAGKKAGIPGTGDQPVVFTCSEDVGKFTARLLTLENWEPVSYIIGDKLTWEEFVKLAQEVTGACYLEILLDSLEVIALLRRLIKDVAGERFEVTYDSVELLKSGKITELPSHVSAYEFLPKETLQDILSQFGLLFVEGLFDFKPKQSLNDLFPEIKPKSAREVLEIGWK